MFVLDTNILSSIMRLDRMPGNYSPLPVTPGDRSTG